MQISLDEFYTTYNYINYLAVSDFLKYAFFVSFCTINMQYADNLLSDSTNSVAIEESWHRKNDEKTEGNGVKLPTLYINITHHLLLEPQGQETCNDIQEKPFQQAMDKLLTTICGKWDKAKPAFTEPGYVCHEQA